MPTALIFKQQAKAKKQTLREKGLAQPHYSIQHIEGYDLICYKHYRKDLNHLDNSKEYCPGTMNIYFIWDRQEQKRLSGIPLHDLVLQKMLNNDCLCSTCQVYQMTTKKRKCKKYGLLLPKIAESGSDSWVMICVNLVGPFTIRTPAKNTLCDCIHNDRSSNKAQVGYEIVEATNKLATSIQDLFHNT
jgi:hypothetical protein